jgi:hypothetical protein
VGDRAADVLSVHGDYNFVLLLGFLAWMAAVSIFWLRSARHGGTVASEQ